MPAGMFGAHGEVKQQRGDQQRQGVGPAPALAAKKAEANFTIKAAKQIDSGVAVGGPDILTQNVTFKGLDNGTNAPLIIETQSEDSAI